MDEPRQPTTALYRTLAQALKRLFKSVKAKHADNPLNAPVDIIRKDLSRSSILPRISTVSLFPDFGCPEVDLDGLEDHASPFPVSSQTSTTAQGSQRALLPAKSLSHFNLHQVYAGHSVMPNPRSRRQAPFWPIETVVHPNIVTVPTHQPVLVSRKSTLQIRRHDSLHASISNATLAASVSSESSFSVIRRTKRSSNLRKCATADSLAADTSSLTLVAEHNSSRTSKLTQEDSSHLVRHFASFCIIDILAPGCPVSAVSEDLRYLYDIKDRFVLNAQECSQLSMDLSVGRDPDGNEVTYLLLFSPLVSPATTKSRFMLVSAIDVSGYVGYAASLETSQEMSEGSKSFSSFKERSKSKRTVSSVSWLDKRTDQLADELLHGCSLEQGPGSDAATPYTHCRITDSRRPSQHSEDIWTLIAMEDGLVSRKSSLASKSATNAYSASTSPPHQKPKQASASTKTRSPLDYADEKVLERFIESLQVLYSPYFLLACSPLNGQFYEICYVSPVVYTSGEYVSGHLSHMSLDLINEFGAHLAAGRRFRTTIRWGEEGVEKQLYCIPLIGHQPAPWICMLVDKDIPIHW